MFEYLSEEMKKEKEAAERKEWLKKEKEERRRREKEEREKEKQREKERQRQKEMSTKTEGNEDAASKANKVVMEMFRRFKSRACEEDDPPEEKQEEGKSLSSVKDEGEKSSQDSASELSSGDESLEMKDVEIELIRKDIVRVGVMGREVTHRETYNMA